MTPEEGELRRALEARSGAVSPEFRARVAHALSQPPRSGNLTPAIAAVAVVALTIAVLGVLFLSHRSAGPSQHGVSSGPRLGSPTPTPAVGMGGVVTLPSSLRLSAPSSTVIWAFYPEFNALFRSTDRGNTWEARPVPMQVGLPPDISFVDDHEGWLLTTLSPETQCNAESAFIWHTTDAGANWELLPMSGMPAAQCKDAIYFADSSHGFVTAWDDNHRPTIYRTSDGGLTWSPSTLPDPPGFTTLGAGDFLQPIAIANFEGKLLLSAFGLQPSGTHRYVFSSVDEGASWQYVATVEPSGAFAFITFTRWIGRIGGGQTQETTDSGRTWHALASDYGQAAGVAPTVVFATPEVGYATVRGELQRTTDGGAHWTMLKSPGT